MSIPFAAKKYKGQTSVGFNSDIEYHVCPQCATKSLAALEQGYSFVRWLCSACGYIGETQL